ncbi:hypothetical protein [Actinomadura latina]|nr:hypothetical protein [Actinomadura latina]
MPDAQAGEGAAQAVERLVDVDVQFERCSRTGGGRGAVRPA